MLSKPEQPQRRPTLQLPQIYQTESFKPAEGTQARAKLLLENNKAEVPLFERSPATFSSAQITFIRSEPIQSKPFASKATLEFQELIKNASFADWNIRQDCIDQMNTNGGLTCASAESLVNIYIRAAQSYHQDSKKIDQIIDYLIKLMKNGAYFSFDCIVVKAFYSISRTTGISSLLKEICHLNILEGWKVHSTHYPVWDYTVIDIMKEMLRCREPSPIIVKTYLELSLYYLSNTSHCSISIEAKYAIGHILIFYRSHPDYITDEILELCSKNDVYLFKPSVYPEPPTQFHPFR